MSGEDAAWSAVAGVVDPELPMLSIVDLGIVRSVSVDDATDTVRVDLTPTYTGCPAIEVIERDVAAALKPRHATVEVHRVLQPAWTTDWMTEHGRDVLKAAGIAPPTGRRPAGTMRTFATVGSSVDPTCPRCDSADVERISQFGSTACKSLWRCRSCLEPFDHFKAL